MPRQEKRRARLEIVYEYHPRDYHRREHWMYYEATGATMEEMQSDAEKHYKSQIRSLGWGKITTLKEIRPLRGVQDPMKVKKVTEEPKPKTSSRRRRTSRAKKK